VECNSELSATHVAVLRVKDDLLSSLKTKVGEVKYLSRMVDAQLKKKLKNEIDIQAMHVKVKQLALEETPERSSNASTAPKTPKQSLAMGLDDKKELATNRGKGRTEEGPKKKELQSNLGFAAGVLQNTLNMNGGMWQSTSIAEVSFTFLCLFFFSLLTLFIYSLLIS
jgi:hypothetical protein